MHIQEMHTAFRVLGQQQGMQLVRGVLPESIDIYINNIINSMVREEIQQHAKTVIQDNVNTQPTALSPTNVLRTLYRNKEISIAENFVEAVGGDIYPPPGPGSEFPDFTISVYKNIKYYDIKTGYTEIYMPVKGNIEDGETGIGYKPKDIVNVMMYLGFSATFATIENKSLVPTVLDYDYKPYNKRTGIRLIGGDVLETTFRDYCNAAEKDSPVASLLTDSLTTNEGLAKEYIQLYTNTPNLVPDKINIKYIAAPAQVKYDIDVTKCQSCDLPEYLHYEIVRRAVALFFATIGSSNSQQNKNTNQ